MGPLEGRCSGFSLWDRWRVGVVDPHYRTVGG